MDVWRRMMYYYISDIISCIRLVPTMFYIFFISVWTLTPKQSPSTPSTLVTLNHAHSDQWAWNSPHSQLTNTHSESNQLSLPESSTRLELFKPIHAARVRIGPPGANQCLFTVGLQRILVFSLSGCASLNTLGYPSDNRKCSPTFCQCAAVITEKIVEFIAKDYSEPRSSMNEQSVHRLYSSSWVLHL